MRKKITAIVAALIFVFCYASVSLAAVPSGLLSPSTAIYAETAGLAASKVNMVDGDANTSFVLTSQFETYDLGSSQNLKSLFYKGTVASASASSIAIVFYNASVQSLGQIFVNSTNGFTTNAENWININYSSVRYIKIETYSFSATVYELDVLTTPVVDNTAPTTPTGLTATSTGPDTVNLSWSASSDNIGVTGYNVYRNGIKLSGMPVAATSYNDSGLTASTSYSYKVTAVDAAGNESGQSTAATATTNAPPDTTPPAVPTGLTATPGDSKVTLSWTANTSDPDLQGYNVYQGATKLTSSPITATSYIIASGLTNGSMYYFSVSSVDLSGNESAKTTTYATPQDTTPPDVPTGLTATVGDTKVTLQWSAVTNSDVAGYNLYRDSIKVNSSPIPATTYTDTGLINGTTYSYRVSAVDLTGNESAKSTAKVATPLTTLVAPTVTAKPGNGIITLSWTPVLGATTYKIYSGATLLGTTTDTSYTVSGLTNGSDYSYTVVASGPSGDSPYSPPATTTPQSYLINPDTSANAPQVGPAVKSAFNFIGLFGSWAYLVLGLLLAVPLSAYIFYLIKKARPTASKSATKKAAVSKPRKQRETKGKLGRAGRSKTGRAPKTKVGKQRAPRPKLTEAEKEARKKERRLTAARRDRYDYLTRLGRIKERDEWVAKTGNPYEVKDRKQRDARPGRKGR